MTQVIEKDVLNIHIDSIELINRITVHGFSLDYKNIDTIEWIVFITRIMVKIDKYKKLSGQEKKELLLKFVTHSIQHLQLSSDIFDFIVRDFVPNIADNIVFASKHMHISTFKTIHKLKKMCRIRCKTNE